MGNADTVLIANSSQLPRERLYLQGNLHSQPLGNQNSQPAFMVSPAMILAIHLQVHSWEVAQPHQAKKAHCGEWSSWML
jgi:hypothetical protein